FQAEDGIRDRTVTGVQTCALPISAANPYFVAAGAKGIESVSVTKVGRTYPFSITQEQFSIEGRGLVREATLEGYRANNEFAKKKIGRASCRERGEMKDVGGRIKKE